MKRRHLLLGGLAGSFLIGCSSTPDGIEKAPPGLWGGRMALQIFNTDHTVADSWSASFTLQGDALAGQLDVFSPLGAQLAQLRWQPGQAWLQQGQQQRTSDSLAELVRYSMGTDLPLEAFFAWLQGQETQVSGWTVDLHRYPQGRISAQRHAPLPPVQLKIILQPAL